MDQPVSDSNRSSYRGSHIFNFAAKRTGLPIDQFNFLIAEILALIFAICFRRYLPPKPNNVLKRHLIGQGSGRGEFRRIFRNSTRGGGGGHNRLNTDSNTPDLANAADFPTLPKQ
ncbi:unnamed protein product [Rotaria sp. Silwood1]|nr:unnamed protein product [Rotaria sp. Silwood1]